MRSDTVQWSGHDGDAKVIREEPPSPRTLNPRVPRDLETICLKAMAKEPVNRYPSCQELAEDLRRFLADEPIRARHVGPVERFVRWCRRSPAIASLAGTSALLLLAVAVVAMVGYVQTSSALKREAGERAADGNTSGN